MYKISVVAVGCLLASCASIERRIEQNADYFGALAPADQEKIRQGQIDIGFAKPMVRIALGNPSSVKQRKTAEDSMEIWVYTGIRTEFVYPGCSPFYYGGGVRYTRHGNRHGRHGAIHIHSPVAQHRRYETGRVIFEGEQVKEIEQLVRNR
jgi:hypothetical protein